ncbi:MAG: hypothetical protein LBQ58_10400 [Synergistaceae bacterium]|jgi:hypothetical protein|nr:hypothetical protein [Synergistaceae bacterium]
MKSQQNVLKRRLAARAVLAICIVALAFLMYNIGKEYDVVIDNETVTVGGTEYAAVGYAAIVIDGDENRAVDIWADDRIIRKMVGANHRLVVKVLNEDDDSVVKSVERSLKLDFNTKALMISIPALVSESSNILVSNPNYSEEIIVVPDAPSEVVPESLEEGVFEVP